MRESKRVIEAEIVGFDAFNIHFKDKPLRTSGLIGPGQGACGGRLFRNLAEQMGLATGDRVRITVEKIDPPKSALDKASEVLEQVRRDTVVPTHLNICDCLEAILQHLKERDASA